MIPTLLMSTQQPTIKCQQMADDPRTRVLVARRITSPSTCLHRINLPEHGGGENVIDNDSPETARRGESLIQEYSTFGL